MIQKMLYKNFNITVPKVPFRGFRGKRTKMKTLKLLILLIGLSFYSCKDDYNNHYDRSSDLPEKSLFELIKADPDLSTFARLIEIGAYKETLDTTQTYTVWAPENSALPNIDLNTISEVQARQIVGNHVARFNNSTAIRDGKPVKMNNRKVYSFSEGGTLFGGVQINRRDILAKNGLLHTIKNQIPFHYNFYEYIKAIPGVSKLRDFISQFDEEIFDMEASYAYIDPKTNQLMYDSVMVFYNRLFDFPLLGLGHIHSEDSIYTMLMPSDEAWDAAYARISPSFKVYPANDSITKIQTSLAIVSDLIYRKLINEPASQDSLISSASSIIHNPAELFGGLTPETASNGLIFPTDNLNYNNRDTWNKPIVVECEDPDARQPINAQTTAATEREVAAGSTTYSVSGLRYLEVYYTNPNSNPQVIFLIPNVLAGKYDIYVEFIPESIADKTLSNDSTKMQFILTYTNARGQATPSIAKGAGFVTSGTKKVRMKVFNAFDFPVSDYYDRIWLINLYSGINSITDMKAKTTLSLQTDVTQTEFNNSIYRRKFRVDRIIFEPVAK